MIGFVEVKVDMIIKAYTHLNNDINTSNDIDLELKKNKKLSKRISDMSDIINNSAGKKEFFKREEKLKLLKMLEEVSYASYASSNDSMFIRIEMASIILDILDIYGKTDLGELINSSTNKNSDTIGVKINETPTDV